MERPKRTESLRFRVTPDEKEALEQFAREQDMSVAAVIRRALYLYLHEPVK